MENRPQDNRFEKLYEDMRSQALHMHEGNKSRIKHGTVVLLLLPVVLGLIRWLTDSDKVLFLLIWVLCMFALSAYLIGVEYLDHAVRKGLEDLTDRETEFDHLLGMDKSPEEIRARAKARARRSLEAMNEAGLDELKRTGVLGEDEVAASGAGGVSRGPGGPEEGGGR